MRTQAEFEPFAYGADMGLNVHAHEPASNRVVVFVHGLGGEGYGSWADFPKFVFHSGADVAVLNYRSGLKRIRTLRRHPSPERTAALLAQELRAISGDYEHMFLFGHSMGGMVAELATCQFFEAETLRVRRHVAPLAGLVAFASPRGGFFPFSLPGLVDTAFLLRRSKMLKSLRDFRSRWLDVELSDSPNRDKHSFPIFALTASNDRWVSRYNGAIGVPVRQVEDSAGTHSSIVKPRNIDEKSVVFGLGTSERIIAMRIRAAKAQRESVLAPDFQPGTVVANLVDDSEPAWDQAYGRALQAAADASGLVVVDSRYAAPDLSVDLFVRVLPAAASLGDPVAWRETLLLDSCRPDRSRRARLGVSPTGPRFEDAEEAVRGWLQQPGRAPKPWVEGTRDSEHLTEAITRWLSVIITFHLQAATPTPDERRAAILRQELSPGGSDAAFGQRFGSRP